MKRAISSAKPRSRSKGSKSTSGKKSPAKRSAAKTRPRRSAKSTSKMPTIPRNGSLRERIAAAKRIEKMDRPKPGKSGSQMTERLVAASASTSRPQRNSDFPDTYIAEIFVRLEDPDHPVTLTWTGPNARAQEAGPFRSSPGAGLRGLNCDELATSKRSGSTCTPKGTFTVTGFASRLSSHPEATEVTWFVPRRGIALHYYPSVPKYAASHGCVRLESKRVAQLIKNNSRADITRVIVDGTWTKPRHQW